MSSFGSTLLLRAAATALVFVLGSTCGPIGVRHAQAQQPAPGGTSRTGWSIPFAGNSSSPIVSDDLLFVGSNDGALYAIDSRTGSIRWRFETGAGLTSGPQIVQIPRGASLGDMITATRGLPVRGRREISATPIVEAGTVYVGSGDHSFYAVDALSGHKKWSYATGGQISNSALIHAGVIVVVSGDGLLYGLDAQSGEKRWAVDTVPASIQKRQPTPPIIQDGAVYVTNWPVHRVGTRSTSFVHAIDSASGRVKWTVEVEGDDPSSPIHAEGLIIFATRENFSSSKKENARLVTVYAIDAASGTERWRHETEQSRLAFGGSNPAIWLDGRIVIATDRIVSALETQTGAAGWIRPSDTGADFEGLAGQGSTVFVGSRRHSRGELLALDGKTGAQKWSTRLGSIFSSIDGTIKVAAVHGDSVYVVAGRYLQRLQLATGKEVWSHKADTPIHARPLVDDPIIYVANIEHTYFGKAPDVGQLQALDLRSGKVKP